MIRKHSLHTVIVMLLILIFTISIAMVLVNGSLGYKKIAENSQKSFDDRTSLSYINAKVRYMDKEENLIFADNTDGLSTLHIVEQIDGVSYSTWIYLHEGSIKELFAETDSPPEMEYGFEIAKAESLSFQQVSSNLILVSCSIDGKNTAEAYLYLRSA